jgi:hypothetical protein
MSGAILHHPLYAFMACTGTTLHLLHTHTHTHTHIYIFILIINWLSNTRNTSQCREHHYLLNCPTMSLFLIISVLGRAIARMSSVTLQTVIILEQLIRMLAQKILRNLSS